MKTGEGTASAGDWGLLCTSQVLQPHRSPHFELGNYVLQEAGLCIIKYLAVLVASPAINRNQ